MTAYRWLAALLGLAVLLALGPATSSEATDLDYFASQWNVNAGASSAYGTQAESVWTTTTGSGAVVGVIDSGIAAHLDLTGSTTSIVGGNVLAGYDFIKDPAKSGDGDGWDNNPIDDSDNTTSSTGEVLRLSWHGLHVTGAIAAKANGFGITGVAPDVEVVPIRAAGVQGAIDIESLDEAIRWGAGLRVTDSNGKALADNSHPADVLNLSMAGKQTCPANVQSAINDAVNNGTVVVVAAGNTWDSATPDTLAVNFPANCANVIAVTSTDYNGKLSSFSNIGTEAVPATIAAPGDPIRSTCIVDGKYCTNGYTEGAATSFATPHVSAVLALLHSARPDLSVAQLTQLITSTATPLSQDCETWRCGAGIVNARRAMAAALAVPKSTQSASPSPTAPSPTTPSPTAPSPSASSTVAPTTPSPVSLGQPTIMGYPKVGVALTVKSSVRPLTAQLTWQWRRGATVVATGTTYTPTPADFNKTITVLVTASSTNAAKTIRSASVKIAAGGFATAKRTKVKGTFRVGRKLKATSFSFRPTATTISYRWLRDGKKIKKATKSTYRLKRADRRHKISVRVTVKRYGYLAKTSTSTRHRVR